MAKEDMQQSLDLLRQVPNLDDGAARRILDFFVKQNGVEQQLLKNLRDIKLIEGEQGSLDDFHPVVISSLIFLNVGLWAEAAGQVAKIQLTQPDNSSLSFMLWLCRKKINELAYFKIRTKDHIGAIADMSELRDHIGGLPRFREESATIDLLRYLETIPASIQAPPDLVGRPHLISIPLWGQRFIDCAARILLPCLMAPGNVPQLKLYGTVILQISTLARDVEKIQSLEVIKELSKHALIIYQIYPDFICQIFDQPDINSASGWGRFMEGVADYQGVLMCQATGADRSWLTADCVLPDGYLSAVKACLLDDYDLVGGIGLRALENELVAKARADGHIGEQVMSLPPDWLYNSALRYLHPFLKSCFAKRKDFCEVTVDPVQFLVQTPEGFGVHGYQVAMLAHSARSIPPQTEPTLMTCDVRWFIDAQRSNGDLKLKLMDVVDPTLLLVSLDTNDTFTNFGARPATILHSAISACRTIFYEGDLEAITRYFHHCFNFPLSEEFKDMVPDDVMTSAEICAEWDRVMAAIERSNNQ
jgi:hypothetical protein